MEMSKLEKVIKEFDYSLKNQHCGFVDGVGDVYAVSEETIRNVIALLKEQESIIESQKSDLAETLDVVANWGNVVRCKDCENFVWNSISQNAGSCGICIGNPPNYWHSKEWFCANGKKSEET